MYRFLLTPRWLGFTALALVLAGVMVLLGNWQLDRYRTRSAINDRIDAAAAAAPAPLAATLPAPGSAAGAAGPAPPADAAWSRVQVSGRYDPEHEILARGRTVSGRVGVEVVTPLVLADGSAVLVDRGWIPPAPQGAAAIPDVPPAPGGDVTIVARVHLSESRPGPLGRRDGFITVRRIAVPQLARELPYPVYGAYLLLDSQTPAADPGLTAVPSRRENAWQNGGYAVQWWLLAALTVIGYAWVVRRHARGPAEFDSAVRDLADADARLPQAPVSPAV
ncbi:MAG TPA: SURF1 family protein [Pilimelia sp.]|nr:SURF1 family protein [Pilimelia sp.]